MTCVSRRLAPWLIGSVALVAAGLFETAAAVEVHCIEESKYKHLYQLFGGDARSFATYLDIDPNRLPDPETCRAVLVSGGIGDPNDREKLLNAVARGKGWLAALYLNSGGGNVWTGQQLGYIVRAFRLKTFTARNAGNKIFYEQDVALPPLSPASAPAAGNTGVAAAPQPQPPRCLLHEHVPMALNAKGFASGIVRPEAFKSTFEENVDHPGGDYRTFDLAKPDAKLCQKACTDEAKCGAWVYRKAEGTKNGRPQCSLKERVLARIDDNLSVSGIARADTPDATYEEHSNRPGADYRAFDLPDADPRLCQKICIEETMCRAWVYGKPENGPPHCWLKHRAPALRNDEHYIAGTVIRALQYTEPTYEANTRRPGADYRDFDLPNVDPKLCQKACIGEARCRAWVYRKPEGRTNNRPHCWLKEHVPAVWKKDDYSAYGTVIRADHFEPIYEEDVNRPGPEYRSIVQTDQHPQLCQKSCADDPRCRAWAYEKPSTAYLASLASGWDAYRARQRSILSIPSPGNNWCASSCVQIHVAGLDRSGIIQVHRPHSSFTTESAQALNESDAAMYQFYKYMDAGPRVTELMEETSSQSITPAIEARFPRYVLDNLIFHCGADPEQLQNLEKQLETTLEQLVPAAADVTLKVDRLRAGLDKLHDRRRRAEQCVAHEEEHDRLAAYGNLCGTSCDQKKLGDEFDAAVRKVQAKSP